MAKTKALMSFAVTAKLICVFVFAYAERWFSHDAAHIMLDISVLSEPRHEKTCLLHIRKQSADQLCGNCAADQCLCFNGALLTVYLYLLYPIATFQKAGICLDAQQSMQAFKSRIH